jgi:hypothetical protein
VVLSIILFNAQLNRIISVGNKEVTLILTHDCLLINKLFDWRLDNKTTGIPECAYLPWVEQFPSQCDGAVPFELILSDITAGQFPYLRPILNEKR